MYLAAIYSALDGCSRSNAASAQIPSGNFLATSSSALFQCCSLDGTTCTRENPLAGNAFWAGDCATTCTEVTWIEADAQCSAAGMRLCGSQLELDGCCGGGGQYDSQIVWTSIGV